MSRSISPDDIFPLRPDLPLPAAYDEQFLFSFLETVQLVDAPAAEMLDYCRQDWRRFVYTWGLASDLHGDCLELGANPYFTTVLLRHFTPLRLTLANYFGSQLPSMGTQQVRYKIRDGATESCDFTFHHFNIEQDSFPFATGTFDLVLFCEIIEHLQMDPVAVIREIKRVLRPGGSLILTTPNVARLENVARLIAGANVYDPYSAYGPYGRHNREYTRHDLYLLLDYCGFDLEVMFTADVHDNPSSNLTDISAIKDLLAFRQADLGQYIFLRARNNRAARLKRPAFLYRSYSPEELE